MKILINGVYTGGNCPPMYYYLKRLGHEIKVLDLTYFGRYASFSEKIDRNDIILPEYSMLDLILFKIYQRTNIFLLGNYLGNIKKKIKDHKFDIFISHQVSIRANLMDKMKLKPHLGFIYGSEIKGKNIHQPRLKTVFNNLDYIITTTDTIKENIEVVYPELKNKIIPFLYSFFEYNKIYALIKDLNREKIRNKYSINVNDLVFFDNRSLRSEELTRYVISNFHMSVETNPATVLLLIKGYSGTNEAIDYAAQYIKTNGLESNIKLIDRSTTEQEHFEMIFLSDVVCSLLDKDQFGEVIMHGMALKKTLLLYALPQYIKILNKNAYYVDSYKESLESKISQIRNGSKTINLNSNYDFAIEHFDADKGFQRISEFLSSIPR